ncbi:MAG: class 3 adenylate cyclase [Candidatus Aldehydirespiratoraceae bacterium]|jgi:class 3 adenylate cyclase
MGPTVETATILFSDIVGSTRMRVALGDAAADDVRRRHDRILGAVIERHGGTVVKHLGDGLMCTFGGSAEAVAAAIEMQREVDREWRRAADVERVAIRIGLSAGDVTWEDGDCHGTPVVTAARLCDAAEGAQVLCDDLVRGLARGRTDVSFELMGELDLKGLAEPVLAYVVPWVDESSIGAPLPGPLRVMSGELPYSGRVEERTRLFELWKAAQIDGGSVVLLVGEPGIGKSRLMAELAREVHAEGSQILLGRCDEQVPAPYAPWIEALRTLVAHIEEGVLVEHVARHGGGAAPTGT